MNIADLPSTFPLPKSVLKKLSRLGLFEEPLSEDDIAVLKVLGKILDNDKAFHVLIRQRLIRKAQKEENTALNHTRGLIGNRDDIVFRISGREVEVLRLITEGFTNKEIAQILKVSLNTVKSHVVHIFDKLGVHDRTQAAVWATQNELI